MVNRILAGPGSGHERRAPHTRHPLRVPVVLVVRGADGPAIHTGSSVDLGRGGCSILLDEPIRADQAGSGTSVLVVAHGHREVTALTGPPLLDAVTSRSVRVTLVPARGTSSAWSELLDELDRRSSFDSL